MDNYKDLDDPEPVIRPACLTPDCHNDQHSRGLCRTCIATFYRIRTDQLEADMIKLNRILPPAKRGRKPGPLALAMQSTTTK